MLKEIKNERLISERRRWFTDEYMDVYVWYDLSGTLSGFQVCFEKNRIEKAFTWLASGYCSMDSVDTGEDSPLKNMTPILVQVGNKDKHTLKQEFSDRSKDMEHSLAKELQQIIERTANQAL